MKNYKYGNFICNVGENAKENWFLLDQAQPEHYFFHLSSFPSCYVILETEIHPVSMDMIIVAANLCKIYTKYRNFKNLKVDYCLCNNVIKGEVIGETNYISNRKVKQIKI